LIQDLKEVRCCGGHHSLTAQGITGQNAFRRSAAFNPTARDAALIMIPQMNREQD
jgi:hypothetical protein